MWSWYCTVQQQCLAEESGKSAFETPQAASDAPAHESSTNPQKHTNAHTPATAADHKGTTA